MNYLPDTAYQTKSFLYSVGLGFSLGIAYDILRMFFLLLTGNDKKFLIARDIIYLLVCLCSTFVFLLVMCDGEVMLYTLIGELLGFTVYYYSLSNIIYKPIKVALSKIHKVLKKMLGKMQVKLLSTRYLFEKVRKTAHENEKICKKDLHNGHGLVYNFFVKLYHKKNMKTEWGDDNGNSKNQS